MKGSKQINNNPKKKILEEMLKNLQSSCYGKGEIDYAGLGEYLLAKWEELTNYYNSSQDKEILKDLKEKLVGIKNWQLLNYNKKLALSICQYLLEQENQEVIIHHQPHSSLRQQKRL